MYEPPRRKRLRYPGHDYRAPCVVHVTLCTHHRQRLFGRVNGGEVRLNAAGRMVLDALGRIHDDDRGIGLDAHIVMPDHVHAIIALGTNPSVVPTVSIPDVVRDFKTRVQRTWPGGVRDGRWPGYESHLWQRSWYDTLIHGEVHLEKARAYILANPARWQAKQDNEFP